MTTYCKTAEEFIEKVFKTKKLIPVDGVAFRKISAIERYTTVIVVLYEAEKRGYRTYLFGDHILITRVASLPHATSHRTYGR